MKPTQLRLHNTVFQAFLACAVALVSTPLSGWAQGSTAYRISQRATISQRIASATLSIDYSRPLARGRSPLFGNVVHWGEIWTPGANEATVLDVSEEVTIEGHQVAAGRWSVWMIPSDVGPWELILDPSDSLFHTERPALGGDQQIRFPVKTETGEPVEILTWSFPSVQRDRATLQLAWGSVRVPLQVEVEFTMPEITMPAADAAQYTGQWEVTFMMGQAPAQLPPAVPMEVVHTGAGSLVTRLPPELLAPPDPIADSAAAATTAQERERAEARAARANPAAMNWEVILVPRGRGTFLLGFTENGVLLDVENVLYEFEFEGGRAVRFTARDHLDQLVARGSRR
jgi:hypothetical protein